MYNGEGNKNIVISPDRIVTLCTKAFESKKLDGKKILVIVPDTTRSGPVSLVFKTICEALLPRVKKLDFLIALGTHEEISDEKLNKHLGLDEESRKKEYKNVGIFQHEWQNEKALQHIGKITAAEIKKISGGLLNEDINVTVNKRIFEYDELVLVGPVFPHEVVGFSGGYKYLFPGISGPEFLHKFHWLGALITNPKINGTKNTPVRATISKAASFINLPKTLLCYVMSEKKQVCGLFIGDEEAWSKAADLSKEVNIKYISKSYKTVFTTAPLMYDEIWTAGKCMYKLEPVVADNGTLIIYAPHITVVSFTHGENIKKIGYHTRDYFLKQPERFTDIPGGTIAHSTHVKGIGTYINGVEKPRINVVLATGISEKECIKINLGYMNYKNIKIEDYQNKEEEGILFVKNAGEILFRIEGDKIPDIDALKA